MECVNRKSAKEFNIKRFFCVILVVYALLVISFFFLAGDQLRFRISRGNIEMPSAEAGTPELAAGTVVEQRFISRIQRIESIAVQWGTSYRENIGTVTMELFLDGNEAPLIQGHFDASDIGEGQALMIASDAPIDGLYGFPLLIRLTADSAPGSAVTPLINNTLGGEGYMLSVNGEPIQGTLCFEAKGTDHIWLGQNYWTFSACFGGLLALLFVVLTIRVEHGKRSFLVNALYAVKKYRFLIRQLVGRDFKTKYKRSILGVFWSFLNPLLMMLVQFFVFSTVFQSNIPNFAAYLIIGTVMFNFFSESCGMSLNSILGNASLITKVYLPKYIYPLTHTMSSVINLSISLIPMLLVCLITGVRLQKSFILAIFFFACLIIFCLGVGMLLATSMVFFRDTQFLWGVLSMMWMYATPIFYPETIVPPKLQPILHLNPLYHFLRAARICILNGVSPEPVIYVQCLAIAFAALLIGATVFYKNQDKFVLYL